jgi:hypothetical protein
MNSVIFKFSFLAFFLPIEGFSCSLISNDLEQKISQYREATAVHVAQIQVLMKEEQECQAAGKIISERAKKLAEAQGCEASEEAGRLDKEIADTGTRCESKITQLKAQQEILLHAFGVVKQDLDDGLDYIRNSSLLREYCGRELNGAGKLATHFVTLETSMLTGIAKATGDATNFRKLKTISSTLTAKNSGNREVCKTDSASLARKLDSRGREALGSGQVKVGDAKNPHQGNTITGLKEDAEKRNRAPASVK